METPFSVAALLSPRPWPREVDFLCFGGKDRALTHAILTLQARGQGPPGATAAKGGIDCA